MSGREGDRVRVCGAARGTEGRAISILISYSCRTAGRLLGRKHKDHWITTHGGVRYPIAI